MFGQKTWHTWLRIVLQHCLFLLGHCWTLDLIGSALLLLCDFIDIEDKPLTTIKVMQSGGHQGTIKCVSEADLLSWFWDVRSYLRSCCIFPLALLGTSQFLWDWKNHCREFYRPKRAYPWNILHVNPKLQDNNGDEETLCRGHRTEVVKLKWL